MITALRAALRRLPLTPRSFWKMNPRALWAP
ncbi:MAG: phage tail assembly chaperone [Parcubacteria group bacterium]|nr:phage tail assembly chaperone [Parcubacteria group bacterium]